MYAATQPAMIAAKNSLNNINIANIDIIVAITSARF